MRRAGLDPDSNPHLTSVRPDPPGALAVTPRAIPGDARGQRSLMPERQRIGGPAGGGSLGTWRAARPRRRFGTAPGAVGATGNGPQQPASGPGIAGPTAP